MSKLSNEEVLREFAKLEPALEKHMGVGIFASDEVRSVPRLPTGLAVIDYILGGGLPVGMISEVYGPEGTGKTTLAAQVIAHNQALNPTFRALYLDFEGTFLTDYAKAGLQLDITKPRFFLSQPNTIEQGEIIARFFVTLGMVDVVVWDTPAASQPAAFVNAPTSDSAVRNALKEIDAGKSNTGAIGLHARVFTQAIASLIPHLREHSVTLLAPNQLRTTINSYGAGETTPGGRGFKFNCSVRIRLSRKETTKEAVNDEFFGTNQQTAIGQLVRFRTVKNKTAPQERTADVVLRYGMGFRDKETMLGLAVKRKVVKQAGGGNFELPDGHKVRGTQNLLTYWEENPEKYEQVIEAMKSTPISQAEDMVALEAIPTTREPEDDLLLEEQDDVVAEPEGKVTL